MAGWKKYTGLIFGWQITASCCYYAIYAVTPFVRTKFGLSTTAVGLMLTVLTLGYTVFLLPIGSVIDKHGERITLFVGLIGLGVSLIIVALSPTFVMILAAVFVLGAFHSPAMPGTNKAVFAIIPSSHQNISMGIKQVGVTAGSGISAVVVPWFSTTRFGWEAAFLSLACVALVVGSLFKWTYPHPGGGTTGDHASIRVHLQDFSYVILLCGGFFLSAGLFSTTGYAILYVNESVGATAVFAGIVLAAAQLSGSTGRIISGWLLDTLPRSLPVASAYVLLVQAGIATALFVVVARIDTPTMALISFVVLGFFILGFTGVYFSCVGGLVDDEEIGNATSGAQLALNCGALVSPLAFGYVVDVSSYSLAWYGLAAVSTIAALSFFVLLLTTGEATP